MESRQKPYCTREQLISLLGHELVRSGDISKAIAQARYSHRLHIRDDGTSYLEQHIFPIVAEVYENFKSTPKVEVAVVVALLHDVLEEDPQVSIEQLQEDFGDVVVELLQWLQKTRKTKRTRTQKDKHEEHVAFGERLQRAPRMCKIIKLLDRLNNLESTDGARNSLKYRRFLADTTEVYLPLAREVDPVLATRMEQEIARVTQELAQA